LIDHGAQQVSVNLATGGNQAGPNFYDDSHAIETFMGLFEMVSHLPLEEDSHLFFFGYRSCSDLGNGEARVGRGNINILQLKWLSGKMKEIATFGAKHARFKRHQPLLRSRRKLCTL
jgi:hypothetical protein